MSNYLERVASSAGRRAALTKPQSSAPPLLPANKDSLPTEGMLPGEDDRFFVESSQERSAGREPTRPGELPEIVPNSGTLDAERTFDAGTPNDAATPKLADPVPRVEPVAQPPASQALLSSESPFTVHLPKTLRPIAATKLPPLAANAPSRTDAPLLPSVDAAATQSRVEGEAPKFSQSVDSVVKESEKLGVDTDKSPVRPKVQIVGPRDERQPQTVRQAENEARESATLPVRPTDRDGPNEISVPSTTHRNEPLSAALPVHMPPMVVGNADRQEQSRISIGRLEVMVNNHPPVESVRPPASAPLRNEKANLEMRYLDRFRLRR